MELTPAFKVKVGGVIMEIILSSLICMYGILTMIAVMLQWKEKGFTIRSLLFGVVSLGIIASVFIADLRLNLLVVCFICIHVLALWEGLQTKGQVSYSHHIFRFMFHVMIVIGVIL